MKILKIWIFGVAAGVAFTLLGAYCFLVYGGMPVATQGGPLPLEHFITKKALRFAMRNAILTESPLSPSEINLQAGAKVYRTQCAVCHGSWEGNPTAIAEGMFPKPPQLLPPHKGVTHDPVGNIRWKVENGIRLTGMPGFVGQLSETDIWQVSLLLLHADQLSPTIQQELTKGP